MPTGVAFFLAYRGKAHEAKGMALEMRPNCERCDVDLPPDVDGAYICSFECTFCKSCAVDDMAHDCPNCGGKLFVRPTRSGVALERFPASTKRVFNGKR